jgi:nucleoside-diphosphate kinase
MRQQTLVLIKPDGVMKGVIKEIRQRYTDVGLTVVKERALYMQEHGVRDFYKEHQGRFYFEGLILSMIGGPTVAMLLEGEDAIAVVRRLNGATNPEKAEPGTIRHDFKSAGGPFNIVHGSDSPEAVERESAIVFSGTM